MTQQLLVPTDEACEPPQPPAGKGRRGPRERLWARVVKASWSLTPFKSAVKPLINKMRYSRAAPRCWARSFRLFKIISFRYGHIRSTALMRSVDADGQPIPWITYPAIEFLKQLDFSDKTVFEYGCGGSTVFWGRVAASVTSVEHVEEFYREIKPMLPSNCTLHLATSREEYIHAVARGAPHDIVVIDGHSRVRCSEIAAQYLRPGGFIILDNSDWFSEASLNLRSADLIEVDMAGIAPIGDHVSTTSFYFRRDFRASPKFDRQPVPAIGSIPKPAFPR
jgi:hypothetical protein